MFCYFIILVKGMIAAFLLVYGVGFIYFTDSTVDIILNTLAVFFVLTIDDVVFTAFTPKLGKAALRQEKHAISFSGTGPSCSDCDGGHIFS